MKATVLSLASLFLAAGCTSAPLEGCRSQADCASAESCVPPGARRACGIGCPQERLCERDDECEAGQVCVEYVASCCLAGEISTRCQPRCDASSCAEGERCDDASGRCEVIPCGTEYACDAHTTCDPSDPDADRHGCARDACTSDADCDGGTCVDRLCYEGPGTCEPTVP